MPQLPIEELLDRHIDAVRSGEATPEEVAARYPEHGAELASMLELARDLRLPDELPGPTAEFRARGRAALLGAIGAEPGEPEPDDLTETLWPIEPAATAGRGPRRPFRLWSLPIWRPAVAAAIICLLLAITGGASVMAQSSLPGEPLYPLKTSTEQARLALTPSDLDRARLQVEFADRRLNELHAVARTGQPVLTAQVTTSYVQAVNQSVDALSRASSSPAPQVATVSSQVADALARQQTRLQVVAQELPPAAQPEVQQAIQTTQRAEAAAQVVAATSAAGSPATLAQLPPTPTGSPAAGMAGPGAATETATPTATQTPTPSASATVTGTPTLDAAAITRALDDVQAILDRSDADLAARWLELARSQLQAGRDAGTISPSDAQDLDRRAAGIEAAIRSRLATPTATTAPPTATATATPAATASPATTVSPSPTATPTATTAAGTGSPTPTRGTATATPATVVPAATPVRTATPTPTTAPAASPAATATMSGSPTATSTRPPAATDTPAGTGSTPTTATSTPTAVRTPTPAPSPTAPTATASPSTPTPTATRPVPTATPTLERAATPPVVTPPRGNPTVTIGPA